MKALYLAMMILTAPPVDARSPLDVALERATVCRAALDLECAETELTAACALASAAGTPNATQVRVWAMTAEVALGLRRDSADGALRQLLELEPAWEAASWPPEWRARLDAVRRTLPDRLPPSLQLIPAGAVYRGQSVTIEVHAADPSGAANVTVFWVSPGNADATPIPLVTANGRLYRGAFPAGATDTETLTFWIEGADQHGNVARLGGPGAATLSIPVLPPGPAPMGGPTVVETPYYETWWFWTATPWAAPLSSRERASSRGRSSMTMRTGLRAPHANLETCGLRSGGRGRQGSRRKASAALGCSLLSLAHPDRPQDIDASLSGPHLPSHDRHASPRLHLP